MSALYIHEPLHLDTGAIRVVTIRPTSNYDTPIELSLRQILVSEDHTCLSYRWGDAHDHENIFINSKQFEVRRSLYDFLRLARKLDITDSLWIDAICINQEDTKERNQQVTQMGDIYEKAGQVLIYPGPLPPGLHDLSFWKRKPPGLSLPEIDAMPYWRRTWILQEILLAQKAFVVTTEGLIEWRSFNKHFPGRSYIGNLSNPLSDYKKWAKGVGSSGYMLDNFPYTECFDLKDRIYAMRSLIPEYATVAVDYAEDEAAFLIRVLTVCVLPELEDLDHSAGVFMLGQHIHGLRKTLAVSIEIICAPCFQALPETDRQVLWNVSEGNMEQLTDQHLLVKATKRSEPIITGDIRVHDHRCGQCGRGRAGVRLEVFATGKYAIWLRIPRVGFRGRLWNRKE